MRTKLGEDLGAQDTVDFFDEPKRWSQTKNELLQCYLLPFFQKVFQVRRSVLYFDGFAGAGHFKNGDIGSPIIAMRAAGLALQNARAYHPNIQFVMSEHDKRRLSSLQAAVKDDSLARRFSSKTMYVQEGFSTAVDRAIELSPEYGTFFFYIDPFGITDLDFAMFKQIARLNGLGSCGVEVLLNFSSVGFLREACCVYHAQDAVPQVAIDDNPDIGSVDNFKMRDARLDRIYGGPEWRPIMEQLKTHQIDFWSAEKQLSETLQGKLRHQFKFVLNMPIRDTTKQLSSDGLLKYRMFHMTNHPKGCNLMNNTMVKRFEEQSQHLLTVDVTGSIVNEEEVSAAFASAIEQMKPGKKYSMGVISAYVISQVGVFARQPKLCKAYLPRFFESGELKRVVETTPKGKPKNSFSEDDEVIRLR